MNFSLKHYIVFIFGSAMLISSNIFCQTSLENLELNTQLSIRRLNKKVKSLDKKDTLLINNLFLLSRSATTLFQKIRDDGNLSQSNDTIYISSLEQSQQALDQLVVNWISDEYAINIINSIKKDYDIKINSSTLGFLTNVISNVEVSVITKSGNENINGYNVFYTYMWDSESKIKKQYFNNQTNNAIKKISPGYYYFWIEKNGEIIQIKPKVEIGNLMLPKETIIFNL